MDREHKEDISKLEADFFSYNRHFTLRRVLKIYNYPVFSQLPKIKTSLIKGRTNWNWSINSETLDTCWPDECFLQWVTEGEKQCHCVPECV